MGFSGTFSHGNPSTNPSTRFLKFGYIMAKLISLNWLKDAKRTSGGRWVKEYRKQTFYFGDVESKSDREGYRRAIEAFEIWRGNIDLQQPTEKPHAEDYKEAIAIRLQIVEWCRNESEAGREITPDDQPFVDAVREELQQLETNFKRMKPPSLGDMGLEISPMKMSGRLNVIWLERLEQVQKHKNWTTSKSSGGSVAEKIDEFVSLKKSSAASKQIKPTTYKADSDRLKHFKTYAGTMDATKITEQTISGFHNHLLAMIGKNEMKPQQGKNLLDKAKTFIRWLWTQRILADLPRNLDSLKIKVRETKIETFTEEEIRILVQHASPKTKLYILLMLNCGMQHMDIAELHQSEFDGKNRITRKRTKTRDSSDKVPVVSWKLWDETAKLLREQKSNDKVRVFINENGNPVYRKDLKEGGNVGNTNNIAKGWERLIKKLKNQKLLTTTKPMILLRKTGPSKLEEHESYGRFAQYFLGQAPQSLAERRYAEPSKEQFDKAVKWLGEQYGFKTSD